MQRFVNELPTARFDDPATAGRISVRLRVTIELGFQLGQCGPLAGSHLTAPHCLQLAEQHIVPLVLARLGPQRRLGVGISDIQFPGLGFNLPGPLRELIDKRLIDTGQLPATLGSFNRQAELA
jgi:hypothetical protein